MGWGPNPAAFDDASNENSSLLGLDKKERSGENLSFAVVATVATVAIGSSFQFGYATGVMNNTQDIIVKYFHDQGKSYSVVGWATTVSCYGIGGLIGAILVPNLIGEHLGRRNTLLVNNIFLAISSGLIAFAPVWWCQAIGRIFAGIVAGASTAVVPLYLSEISPKQYRGVIGSMHQLGVTTGILISQVLSTPSLNLLGSQENWKWLFLVPVLVGFLEVIVLPFCPQSPSYIYRLKGEDAARRVLVTLHSEDSADDYLKRIKDQTKSSSSGDSMTVMGLIKNRSFRKQLIVAVATQTMMQFAGTDAILYYSTMVFKSVQVKNSELATTYLGVVLFVSTLIAARFTDSIGRKPLLTFSWIGMCASYTVLTFSLIFNFWSTVMDTISIISTACVLVFFSIGPGCIVWIMLAEMFPIYARDTASTIGSSASWISNFIVSFGFPILLTCTHPYTFFLFVATTAFSLFFTIRFVPETRHRTVDEISNEFKSVPLWTC